MDIQIGIAVFKRRKENRILCPVSFGKFDDAAGYKKIGQKPAESFAEEIPNILSFLLCRNHSILLQTGKMPAKRRFR